MTSTPVGLQGVRRLLHRSAFITPLQRKSCAVHPANSSDVGSTLRMSIRTPSPLVWNSTWPPSSSLSSSSSSLSSFSTMIYSKHPSTMHGPLLCHFSTSSSSGSSGDGDGGKDGKGDVHGNEITKHVDQEQNQIVHPALNLSENEIDDNNIDITASPIESTEYDPIAIMKTFHDTSYIIRDDYDDNQSPSKLASMTNEQLMDTSTIPGWDYLIHSPPVDKAAIPKGALVGTVVSTKMMKTINVAVDRYKVHAKYRKRIRYTRKFMAHDEEEVACDGDIVLIVPSQRISKHKHFMLRQIVRAKGQL